MGKVFSISFCGINIKRQKTNTGLFKKSSNTIKAVNSKVSQAETRLLEIPPQNTCFMQIYFSGVIKKNKINFRGKPWLLNLNDLGTSKTGTLTAGEAIRIYDKFRLGNYLDVHDDLISPNNKLIREENLSFLSSLYDLGEQKKFITYYKELTGFPNLYEVSTRIEQQFLTAINKTETFLKKSDFNYPYFYDILCAGYDSTCSTGRRLALPGSDLDKAFVIVRGSDSDTYNRSIIEKFSGCLWNFTDQRILSYNHLNAFPQIYTISQLNSLITEVKSRTNLMRLNEKIILPSKYREKLQNLKINDTILQMGYRSLLSSFIEPQLAILEKSFGLEKTTTQFELYKGLLKQYNEDFIKANPFYLNLCKKFSLRYSNEIDRFNISRENIKNFGFFIEALREGKLLINQSNDFQFSKLFKSIIESDAYQLTNLSQLSAIKNSSMKKNKIVAREKMVNEFSSLPIEKQYNLVKAIISNTCGDTQEFPQYFDISQTKGFDPLIIALIEN